MDIKNSNIKKLKTCKYSCEELKSFAHSEKLANGKYSKNPISGSASCWLTLKNVENDIPDDSPGKSKAIEIQSNRCNQTFNCFTDYFWTSFKKVLTNLKWIFMCSRLRALLGPWNTMILVVWRAILLSYSDIVENWKSWQELIKW